MHCIVMCKTNSFLKCHYYKSYILNYMTKFIFYAMSAAVFIKTC